MTEQLPENLSERERRELAFAHRGQVADEPAEAVEPRRMPQMVSLRLDGEIAATLREIANERGISLSDALREGADCVIAAWRGSKRVAHVSFVSSTTPGRAPVSGSYDVLVHMAAESIGLGAPVDSPRHNVPA